MGNKADGYDLIEIRGYASFGSSEPRIESTFRTLPTDRIPMGRDWLTLMELWWCNNKSTRYVQLYLSQVREITNSLSQYT